MGVDVTLYTGIGVYIPRNYLKVWRDRNDPEGYRVYWGVMEDTLRSYTHLSFASPNNSWIDSEDFERGVVIYVYRVSGSFDMRYSVEAGVFRPSGQAITLDERNELNDISMEIAGREFPIEPIVAVSVS